MFLCVCVCWLQIKLVHPRSTQFLWGCKGVGKLVWENLDWDRGWDWAYIAGLLALKMGLSLLTGYNH